MIYFENQKLWWHQQELYVALGRARAQMFIFKWHNIEFLSCLN